MMFDRARLAIVSHQRNDVGFPRLIAENVLRLGFTPPEENE